MRELAVQSANDTNSASDRSSLQAEVNQLKQEMDRISSTTEFNGKKLLDGTMTTAQFQVGANANQTISFGINSAAAADLGVHALSTTNTMSGLGIEVATSSIITSGAMAGNTGAAFTTEGAAVNGITGETITITAPDASTATEVVGANEEMSTTVAALNLLDGVSATASNQATLSGGVVGSANSTNHLYVNNVDVGAVDLTDEAAMNTAINAAITAGTLTGVTSELNSAGSAVIIRNTTGSDITVGVVTTQAAAGTAAIGGSIAVSGADAASTTVTGSAWSAGNVETDSGADWVATGGSLSISLENGYSLSTNQADRLFTASGTQAASAAANTTGGNNVADQSLTIVGPEGSSSVSVVANYSANAIAGKVNAVSADTGVTAEAKTTATLTGLVADGTVAFTLQGTNAEAVNISATVTTTNLSSLTQAINDQSGNTGITAKLSGDSSEIILTQATGHDIKIGDYTHSTNLAANTLTVKGHEGAGVALIGNSGSVKDSTVVGGEVSFSSSGTFNISSSIATGAGSLFTATAGGANVSALSSINNVDITTVEGSGNAIKSIDGALMQIDNMRGELGAVQNRFESTIANLSNVSENLSAARSRILDADIAQETSAMTKNNILQQAGVSILAQANQAPQLALSLLG
jgi:flagellin